MRLLVLFAAWLPNEEANTQHWTRYYLDVLNDRFADCDKYVVVNCGSCPSAENALSNIKRCIALSRAPEHLQVSSDASAFQHALTQCASVLRDYDYVLLMHMKGVSHDYGTFDPVREWLNRGIFNTERITAAASASHAPLLIAQSGHMSQSAGSIEALRRLASELNISTPAINFAATLTLYAIQGSILDDLVRRMPKCYLSNNLNEVGQNRFFFEGPVPSLLGMLRAHPVFLGGCSFEPGLSEYISYNCSFHHNSALVNREYAKWMTLGTRYYAMPVPFVFGPLDEVKRLQLSFGP